MPFIFYERKHDFTGEKYYVYYPNEIPIFFRSSTPTLLYGLTKSGKSLLSIFLASQFTSEYKKVLKKDAKVLVFDSELTYYQQLEANSHIDIISKNKNNFIIKETPTHKDFEYYLGVDLEFEIKTKKSGLGEKDGKMTLVKYSRQIEAPIEKTIKDNNVKMIIVDSLTRFLYLAFPVTAPQNFGARADWSRIVIGMLERLIWKYNMVGLIILHSQKPFLSDGQKILPPYGGKTLLEFFKICYYLHRKKPGKEDKDIYGHKILLYYVHDLGYDNTFKEKVYDGALLGSFSFDREKGLQIIDMVDIEESKKIMQKHMRGKRA